MLATPIADLFDATMTFFDSIIDGIMLFLHNAVAFFRESPLSRGRFILHILAMGLLSVVFIWGGIHLFQTQDFSGLVFVLVGLLAFLASIGGINRPAAQKWWDKKFPPTPQTND
ncbi:MAG: hypothetical protein WCT50_02640 [Patescibacteria group bacterium]